MNFKEKNIFKNQLRFHSWSFVRTVVHTNCKGHSEIKKKNFTKNANIQYMHNICDIAGAALVQRGVQNHLIIDKISFFTIDCVYK